MKNDFENVPLFERDINSIDSSDLDDLKRLEEGWFVEFKSTPPESAKIARSISSFANTYGGILLFGIVEEQKTRKLKSIDGFTLDKAEQLVVTIRQSVQAHVTPSPYFESKIIKIPEQEGKYIVWVKIPKGNFGPYLHSSGVIYIRVGDSSTPKPMNDIGFLERMWREGDSHRERVKKRIEHLNEVTAQNIPRIEMFICEDDSIPSNKNDISFRKFKELALAKFKNGSNSVFNTVYPLDSSFVAQRMNLTSAGLGILWDYDCYRKLHHVSIPIATLTWKKAGLNLSQDNLKKYSTLVSYLNENAQEKELFLIDMSYCLGLISQVITKIYQFTDVIGSGRSLFINAVVSGVKDSLAILNLNKFYEELNSGVVPLIFRDPGFVFPLEDYQKWESLDFKSFVENENLAHDVGNSIAIFTRLCNSIGITTYSTLGVDDDDNANPEELVELFTKLLTENYSFNCESNPNYQKP